MKRWKRSETCLNCGRQIDTDFNYCPHCGQENDDRNVSFAKLINEFFSNYLSLDSRFARSIVPFLINPGFLTNRFNQGKRKNYANPIRLYLVVSLFYFFFMTLYLNQHTTLFSEDGPELGLDNALPNVPDSIDLNIPTSTELKAELDELDSAEREEVKNLIKDLDTIPLVSEILQGIDSADFQNYSNSDSTINLKIPTFKDSISDDSFISLTNEQWEIFVGMKNDLNYSTQDILDSLEVDKMGSNQAFFTKQVVRIGRSSDTFISYVMKNLPIMMFLMLPLFALILKLLYIRGKTLYIQHLIHSIHIHSVAFFFYGLAFIVGLIFNPEILDTALYIALFLVTIYSYISYLKVYNQKWFKTFVKFALTGYFYGLLLFFGLILEILTSFVLF